jgi:hypothetical protein
MQVRWSKILDSKNKGKGEPIEGSMLPAAYKFSTVWAFKRDIGYTVTGEYYD